MALIPCPECKRDISSAASACPHCGFPNPATAAPPGPACYACAAPATTRCAKCGALSCATHLKNIFVRGIASNELRCDKCYERADANNAGFVMCGVLVLIVAAGALLVTTCSTFGR